MFFPAIRGANELGPVVDRLESEHRVVSDLFDRVEAASGALSGSDSEAQRRELANALGALSRELLVHLEFEEANSELTVTRMQGIR